jgi:peptidoglycan hydrolase CwlO-like protein
MNESDLKTIVTFFKEQLQDFKADLKQLVSSMGFLKDSVADIKIILDKVDRLSSNLENKYEELERRVSNLEAGNTLTAGEKRGKENTIKFTWLIWGSLLTGIVLIIVKWLAGI